MYAYTHIYHTYTHNVQNGEGDMQMRYRPRLEKLFPRRRIFVCRLEANFGTRRSSNIAERRIQSNGRQEISFSLAHITYLLTYIIPRPPSGSHSHHGEACIVVFRYHGEGRTDPIGICSSRGTCDTTSDRVGQLRVLCVVVVSFLIDCLCFVLPSP